MSRREAMGWVLVVGLGLVGAVPLVVGASDNSPLWLLVFCIIPGMPLAGRFVVHPKRESEDA